MKIKLQSSKEIPKADSNHTCLAVIILDSVLKKVKNYNYYPQIFLKKCKYIKKKVARHITVDLERSFDIYDDSDDSDEE